VQSTWYLSSWLFLARNIYPFIAYSAIFRIPLGFRSFSVGWVLGFVVLSQQF
jgi:hypothetical protein